MKENSIRERLKILKISDREPEKRMTKKQDDDDK